MKIVAGRFVTCFPSPVLDEQEAKALGWEPRLKQTTRHRSSGSEINPSLDVALYKMDHAD